MSSALVDEEVVAVSRQDVEVNHQEEEEVLLLLIPILSPILILLILLLLLLLSPILILLRWLRWADRRGSSSPIHNIRPGFRFDLLVKSFSF